MAKRLPSSILPPPLRQHPAVSVPRAHEDSERIQGLLFSGTSPVVARWPDEDTKPTENVGDWRPTPPAFVIPERPEKGTATLTMVRGLDAGRAYPLNRARTIIGRAITCDVQIDDTSISRCHASITRTPKGQHVIEDLDSTNGTFIRGRRVTQQILSPDSRIQLGPNVVFRFSVLTEDEGTLQSKLFECSVRDGLTGVYNRASLFAQVDDAVREAARDGAAVSVLMIDLDRFKEINDELGHAAGDEILRAVADQMQSIVRDKDSVARYGGEEFVVVARDTVRADANVLAERLRASIAALRVATHVGTAATTASIGVAALSECDVASACELLHLADERMYEAKRSGRNRVFP